MWQQGYSHTSLVPLRCKPSCQSGPKALPSLSDAPLSLPFSSLPEGKRWSRSDLVCILPCPQNSEQGFSINKKNTKWLPKGKRKCNSLILPAWCLEPCSFCYDFGHTYVCVMFAHAVLVICCFWDSFTPPVIMFCVVSSAPPISSYVTVPSYIMVR